MWHVRVSHGFYDQIKPPWRQTFGPCQKNKKKKFSQIIMVAMDLFCPVWLSNGRIVSKLFTLWSLPLKGHTPPAG